MLCSSVNKLYANFQQTAIPMRTLLAMFQLTAPGTPLAMQRTSAPNEDLAWSL